MRTALLARVIRPPLTIDYGSRDDRLTSIEPVEIYGTDSGEPFMWRPYSDYGPVVPPDLPMCTVPTVRPWVYRAPPPKPLVVMGAGDYEPCVVLDPTYTVYVREWACMMEGKQYRWMASVYCAFDHAAGDWIVCGEPVQRYEPCVEGPRVLR